MTAEPLSYIAAAEAMLLANQMFEVEPSNYPLKRQLNHRLKSGGDAWKMFRALADIALSHDQDPEAPQLSKATRWRIGRMLVIMEARSPARDPKRPDTRHLFQHDGIKPVLTGQSLTAAQVREVVSASDVSVEDMAIRCGTDRRDIKALCRNGLSEQMPQHIRWTLVHLARKHAIIK